jgi:lysozyme
MATKESRLAQIYRQELAKNRGFLGSFAGASGARVREITDLRRHLLPQMGITGAISQRVFGKPFRYGNGMGTETTSNSSSGTDRVVSDKLTRIDINSKMTAKNTIVLPAMARDMNLMRLNMQKMVTLSGGTASIKSDMFFKRAADREALYESQFKKTSGLAADSTVKKSNTIEKSGGFLSSIVDFLKLPLLSMFTSLFGALLKGGLIASIIIGVGALVREMFNNKEFRDKIFTSINDIVKSIFGDDVWKNLAVGVAAAALAFGPLNIALGLLSSLIAPLNAGLSGLVSFIRRHPLIFGITVGVGAAMKLDQYIDAERERKAREGLTRQVLGRSAREEIVRGGGRNMTIAQEVQMQIKNDEEQIKKLEAEIAQRKSKSILNVADRRYIANTENQISGLRERIRLNTEEFLNKPEYNRAPNEINSPPPTRASLADQGREGRDRGISPTRVNGISDNGIKLIAEKEGFSDKAYWDNSQYSIGYGTRTDDPEEIAGKKTVTREEAMRRLKDHVEKRIRPTLDPLTQRYGWNQAQYDAMASFAYNLGEGALTQVTAGGTRTNEQISAAMMEYNKERKNGSLVVNTGLTARRSEEQRLFTSGTYGNTVMSSSASSSAPSITQNTPRTPSASDTSQTSIFQDFGNMLTALFSAIGATNESVQQVAAASARSNVSDQSMRIPNPYDSQLFETLLNYHTELGTPVSS